MKRILLAFALPVLACGNGKSGTDARLEHPAAGASDSVIGQSKLPGAAGVRKALEAQDSARARRTLEDSTP